MFWYLLINNDYVALLWIFYSSPDCTDGLARESNGLPYTNWAWCKTFASGGCDYVSTAIAPFIIDTGLWNVDELKGHFGRHLKHCRDSSVNSS